MRVPLLILVTLLVAALVIGGSGVWLARREWQQRIPADRAALRDFSEQWQNELVRLKEVYDSDLEEIADAARDNPLRTLTEACRNLHGVCGNASISSEAKNRPERVTIDLVVAPAGERLPEVWIARDKASAKEVKNKTAFVLLSEEVFGHTQMDAHGWLFSPNKDYGVFWRRTGDRTAVVLMTDWREVGRQTDQHLLEWAVGPYSELRAADRDAVVLGADNHPLLGIPPSSTRMPDLVIPMHSRMGAWEIVSWDRIITQTSYSSAGLAISLSVSLALVLSGLFVFQQQARAHRVAEQRVSFVNRVSHELGTPLTNMLLNLDLATEAFRTKPEQALQRLSLVTDEVQRLARLVSNVLTFSRKERGAVQLQASCCVPDEVLSSVLRQFEPALRRRGITPELETAAGDGVLLDRDALAQIVGNLLSNVEKYAADGKRVTVETWQDGEFLWVAVRDYGPGIPLAERKRIFQPFTRLSNRVDEGASGTGLGLAIARDLVERMGGRVTLVTCPGPGCRFEIVLPAARVLAPVPCADQSAA